MPLRAALERLLAAQDVDASVGERIAAITEARTALDEESRWNANPESGATATESSAASAPSVTRSGDDSTVCPRCRHASHSSRCRKAMKNAGEEFECGCRGAAPRAEGLDVLRVGEDE